MNKDDIHALKKKHRLERVMQDTGEVFEVNSQNPDHWQSTVTPGLTVDISRQLFEIKLSDKTEAGDVLAWLRRRYNWTFGMALRFLQNRPLDPMTEASSQSAKKKSKTHVQNMDSNSAPLDRWQAEALDIAGNRIKPYFALSFWELILCIEEVRIEEVIAPQVTHCQRCEKLLDWMGEAKKRLTRIPALHGDKLKYTGPLPQIAYTIKRHARTNHLDFHGSQALEDLAYELAGVFVEDAESIVCLDCAWDEYRFQIALALCVRSAESRERQAEREREPAARDSGAGGERTGLF